MKLKRYHRTARFWQIVSERIATAALTWHRGSESRALSELAQDLEQIQALAPAERTYGPIDVSVLVIRKFFLG